MKRDNAIITALEYEEGVHKACLKAADKTSDETGKRIFLSLAEEEMGHIQYLQERLQEWEATGNIHAKELGTSVPTREAIDENLQDVRKALRLPKHNKPASEIELLKHALLAERKVSLFYKEMAAVPDGDGQKLFQRLAEIEEGQEEIVEAEIDFVKGNGLFHGHIEFGREVG